MTPKEKCDGLVGKFIHHADWFVFEYDQVNGEPTITQFQTRNAILEIEEHYFIPKLVGYMVFAPVYGDYFVVTQGKDNTISVTPEISKKYEPVLVKGASLEVFVFDV